MTLASVCFLAASAGASAFAPVAPHPRLFADEAEFAAAKERIASCEEGRAALGVLMRVADSTIAKKPLERKMEGRRLLGVSRDALERIGCLAFAWRYTGDRRYAERAAAEAKAVCAFSDWNPSHFLDVGEMTLAVAIARDWLDGFLSDEDRRVLSSAILLKGLTTGDGKTLSDGWWVKGGNNWNQVCNGGLAAGAAAVRDEYPEVAEAILIRSRGGLPHAMKAYAGGNFPEGPGYWEYATDYTAVALDVLEKQFADGAPELFATDGLAAQVDYLDSVTGPTGLYFNYSDPFTNPFAKRRPIASCWYLARRFRRADALDAHERALVRAGYGTGRMQPFLLLWLTPPQKAATESSALCRVMGGVNPIAVLRSGRGADDWYVGVKGGCPSESHGHMDGGSFVVDAAGVRWACDLGCEAYNRIEQMKTINLWSQNQDSSRWSLFRLGTEGHGTLVIDGKQQNVKGRAKISGENPAVVDLTPLYPSAKDVKREFALGKEGLRVSDSIAGLASGAVVTWNMNTSAKAVANGNRLVLEAKDAKGATRRMELTAEPSDVAWETESIAEPRTKADSPNPGITRVRFRRTAGADGALALSVAFRLLDGGAAKGVCNAEVCPERQNDFCWENDKFGMRAYGPGEHHKWSGWDVFNKMPGEPGAAAKLLHGVPGAGNWHEKPFGGVLDNYTIGASRGLGGIALWGDGEWKTYPDWESSRVIHTGDDYCEFELVYPAFSAAGKMTCHVTLKRGERFFRNDVSFEHPERFRADFRAGPGIDLEPKRDHKGVLVEEPGLVSLFEDPKGDNGSTMEAIFVADPSSVEVMTDHMNCRVLAFRKPNFTYWAGTAWSKAGEITTPEAWIEYVRAYRRDAVMFAGWPLQKRIDEIAANGGGTLTLTAGVYRTGAIFFKPGVNLHLEKGATILGVDEAEGYPQCETRIEGETCLYYPALVNADRCDGFRISGEGVIDGHGANTWEDFWKGRAEARKNGTKFFNKTLMRPRLLYVSHSKNVDVSGVTFKNSKFWTTHYYDCEDVVVHDCTIVADILKDSEGKELKGPSTDAIDIDKCRRFTVRNVDIAVNDDGVVVKGGKGAWANDYAQFPGNGPSQDVLVENCTFRHPTHSALTLGSECPAATNVTMRACTMDGCGNMVNLKMRTDTPQRYANVLVEGCKGKCRSFFRVQSWSQYHDDKGRTKEELKSYADGVTLRNNVIEAQNVKDLVWRDDVFEISNLVFDGNLVNGAEVK